MKLSTRGGYAIQIAIALVLLVSLFYILGDLHHDRTFGYLYPVSWLMIIPYGHTVASFINSFAVHDWWRLVEIGIMFLPWVVIFFLLRGFYYYLTTAGDMSTWKAFVICIGAGLIFFIIILMPVYKQIDVWWEAWPEMQESRERGVE